MKFSRRLTCAVGLSLALSLIGLPQVLAGGGSLNGSIVRSADQSPMVGARIHIANPRTKVIFSSAPAGRKGTFSVAEIPADRYSLAVEHEGGLYVVETPLRVTDGGKQTLNLAVTPMSDLQRSNLEKTDDSDDPGGLALWDNPLTATLVGLGIAVVLGVVLGGDDDPSGHSASESNPT